jgi:type II secretory pathway pseudopilin PulG
MAAHQSKRSSGFTLMETVIAIGVLAVLITAFLAVFGPATQGIRRSINVQDADRLVATLEKELSILRDGQSGGGGGGTTTGTAFNKAFDWIRKSNEDNTLIMLYQYRGDPDDLRKDGTMQPFTGSNGVAGKDYVVQSIARLRNDPLFLEDLDALEGRVFAVKARQLVYKNNGLAPVDTLGQIQGMTTGTAVATPDEYPDAVIAFSAEFYALVSNDENFLKPGGGMTVAKHLKKPVFTRNLGARR